MSEYWFSVSGDTVTLHAPSIGTRSHTEEALRGLGWESLSHFISTLRGLGQPYQDRSDSDAEMLALQTRPQHVEASCEEEKPVKSLGALLREKLAEMEHPFTRKAPDPEPKRAPLPYFTEAKRFDPFSEFIVHHREEVSVNAKPFAGLSLDGCSEFKAPRSL